MTLLSTFGVLIVSGTLVAGCAAPSARVARHDQPSAICHVCAHNNDLACESVRVGDTTPSVSYQGKAYYFCSEACRTKFLERPEKYLPDNGTP